MQCLKRDISFPKQCGLPTSGQIRTQDKQIAGVQINLCKIERRGLPDSQAAPCNLLIMDLLIFSHGQVENVCWATLGKNELCAA